MCSRQDSVARGEVSEAGKCGLVKSEVDNACYATTTVEGEFETSNEQRNVLWSLDVVSS